MTCTHRCILGAGLTLWASGVAVSICSYPLAAAVCHVDHPPGHAMLPMPAP